VKGAELPVDLTYAYTARLQQLASVSSIRGRSNADRLLGPTYSFLEKFLFEAVGHTQPANLILHLKQPRRPPGKAITEVKTTVGYERAPFHISPNERSFSKERPDAFRLILKAHG
jgi:hypothetical protein